MADFISVLLTEFSTAHFAFAGAVVAGFLGVLFVLCVTLKGSAEPKEPDENGGEGSPSSKDSEQTKKPPQQSKAKGGRSSKPARKVTLPSHPLLACDFKGHTGAVLSMDFDFNGKFLVSCSEDRTIRLWFMKTLTEKEHKYTRKNVELDHATHVKFSPDGTAVIISLAGANTISVFRINKQKGGTVTLSDAPVEFPKLNSKALISMGIASTGKFIMTCTETAFSVLTLKGDLLSSVETHQAPNSSAAVSPCGKFIACAGFTPDVKLWEVEFTKTGDFQQLSRAMELKGHHAAVLSLSFSADSHRMATVSNDGTWKFWDIDVRYNLQEDPKLLQSGKVPDRGPSLVALAPDARVVGLAVKTSIFLFSTSSGELMETLGNVHGVGGLMETLSNVHGDTITSLVWEPSSLYLASAGGADRHIRLWHNAPGQKELIKELQPKVPKASSEPLKRRLQQQIKEAQERLQSLGQTV